MASSRSSNRAIISAPEAPAGMRSFHSVHSISGNSDCSGPAVLAVVVSAAAESFCCCSVSVHSSSDAPYWWPAVELGGVASSGAAELGAATSSGAGTGVAPVATAASRCSLTLTTAPQAVVINASRTRTAVREPVWRAVRCIRVLDPDCESVLDGSAIGDEPGHQGHQSSPDNDCSKDQALG